MTRSKKALADEAEKDNTEAPTAVKPKRQVASVAKAVEENKPAAHRPRGRPRKLEVIQYETAPEDGRAPKRNRAHAGSGVTKTTATISAPPETTSLKKKVTFQGLAECDKENQPALYSTVKTKGRAAALASGIRAKPVRRPATTSRAVKANVARRHDEASTQRVLTPKKVRQVAKSSFVSDSDDDELNGAKTPIRDLSQSPRRNASVARNGSPVKRLDFGSDAFASSPVKSQVTSTLLSPAKRPPSSPYKEAFKESPRRGDFSIKFPQVPRFDSADKASDPTSSSSAMFLQSPKRVPLETARFPLSTSKVGESPFKASLLQSPPKRPVSPVKTVSIFKADKCTANPKREADTEEMMPDATVSSNYRVYQSPQRSVRVHRVATEEQDKDTGCTIDFDESVVDIRSPLKINMQSSDFLDQAEEDPGLKAIESDLLEDRPVTQAERIDRDSQNEYFETAEDDSTLPTSEDVENTYAAPASLMLCEQTQVNAAPLLFRDSRLREDDEPSEDELLSPVRTIQPETPATILGNRSHFPMMSRPAFEQAPAFTPLAAQLGGWLASSPGKEPAQRHRQRGLFSPIAAQHVPGEVIIDRRSPATSRVSTGPRLSMPARRSIGTKKSLGQRSSLAVSVIASPDQSSHFADEMAVKDLEEAIESMQANDQETNLLEEAVIMESTNEIAIGQCNTACAIDKAEDFQAERLDDANDGQVVEENHNPLDELSYDTNLKLEIERMTEEAEDLRKKQETTQESTASSAYADENLVSTTSTQQSRATLALFVPPTNRNPLNDFTTPSRPQRMHHFANTVVSKVPLRAEGHMSPIKVPKKRSRSLSAGPSSVKKTPVSQASGIPRTSTINDFSPAPNNFNTLGSVTSTPGQQSFAIDDFGDSTLDGIDVDEDDENLPPVTPMAASIRIFTATPSKNAKDRTSALSPSVLQGAVVFVDVHTTEGADASGIFFELLAQMGAKCVKNWSWNPRASMGVNVEDSAATPSASAGSGKIGITHVVYKDGGKRTLEKVRDTDGVVKCVGVGWVLE